MEASELSTSVMFSLVTPAHLIPKLAMLEISEICIEFKAVRNNTLGLGVNSYPILLSSFKMLGRITGAIVLPEFVGDVTKRLS